MSDARGSPTRSSWLGASLLCAAIPLIAGLSGDIATEWFSGGDGLLEHKLYWRERVLAGEWPLWYPSALLGLPHTGLQQTGDFSPYNLLLLAFGPVLGANLLLLLPMSVGGLGIMATLAARWRRSPLPEAAIRHAPWIALCAGLGIALGSFIAPQRHHLALAAAASFVPWVAWAIEGRRWVWAGSLGGVSILCGNPQLLVIGAPWLLWRFFAVLHGRYRAELPGIALGVAAGLLLLLPQLLATLEYLPFTARGRLDYAEFTGVSAPPWHQVLILSPFLWGGGVTISGEAVPFHGWGFLIEYLQVPGFLLLATALVGLLHGRTLRIHHRLVLLVLAAFSLLAVFGDQTAFGWILYHVPGINLFRAAGRWIFLLDLVVVELAVLGLIALCTRPRLLWAWLAYLVATLMMMAPAIFATHWWAWRLRLPADLTPPWQMRGVFVQLCCAAAALILVVTRGRWASLRRVPLPVLIAVLATVELSFMGIQLHRSAIDPGPTGPQPGLAAVAERTRLLVATERPYAPLHRPLGNPQALHTPHDQRLANVYQPLAPRRLCDLLGIEDHEFCNDRVVEQRPDLLRRFGIGRALFLDEPELRNAWTSGRAGQLGAPDEGAWPLRGGPREEPATASWPVDLPAGGGAVLELELETEGTDPQAAIALTFDDGLEPRSARPARFLPGDADYLSPWLVVAPSPEARNGRLVLTYTGPAPLSLRGGTRVPLHIAPTEQTASRWRAVEAFPRVRSVHSAGEATTVQTRVRFARALRRSASRERIEHTLRTGVPALSPDVSLSHTVPADDERSSQLVDLSIERDEPERFTARANTTAGGWLVLCDMSMPGWTVTVDGAPATPIVIDGWLRGVQIPAGEVTVEWSYRPRWLGLWPWSWGAWAVLLAVGLWLRRRRVVPAPPAED